MNRRTKYYRRNACDRLDKLDLMNIFYADEAAAHRLKHLWLKHEDYILRLWRRLFPCTRPSIWWWLNYPDNWRQLRQESLIDNWFQMTPWQELQAEALHDLGELDEDEIISEQTFSEFSYKLFKEAYYQNGKPET